MTTESIAQGVNYTHPFTIYNSAGAPVAPDSPPTISVIHKNAAHTTIAGATISQLQNSVPAPITGYYVITVPTSTLNVNDQIDVRITATINGFVAFRVYSFTINGENSALPYIT